MSGVDVSFEIDAFIIDRMTGDARVSFRSLARELGVSPDTVIGRYRRMEERGVINGSTTVFDPSRLGYQGMAAFHIDTEHFPPGEGDDDLDDLF